MIYKKYFLKNILRTYFGFGFVFVSIVWILKVFGIISVLIKVKSIKDIVYICALCIPSILYNVTPIITLLSNVFYYYKIKQNNELLILLNSGLSHYQISINSIKFSFFVTITSLMISFYLMPISVFELKRQLHTHKANFLNLKIKENTFVELNKNVIMYVDKVDNMKLFGVSIIQNKNDNPVTIIAKSGEIITDENFEDYILIKDGVSQVLKNKNLETLKFKEIKVKIKDKKQTLEEKNKSLNELSISAIMGEIQNKKSKFELIKLKSEMHQRILWPLYNIFITIIFLYMFLGQKHSRRAIKLPLIIISLKIFLTMIAYFSLINVYAKYPDVIFLCYFNVIALSIFFTYKMKCIHI